MSREIKKLSLQYEFLKLELEELQDEMDQLSKDWSTRFGKYFIPEKKEMWKDTDTGEIREDNPEVSDEIVPKRAKDSKIKNLYRKISTKTHPDRGGNKLAFMKANEAYEKQDYIALLLLASTHKVDYIPTEDDLHLYKKSIEDISRDIDNRRKTMMWQYYKGSSNTKKFILDQIEKVSGKKIDPKDLVD